jgi:cytochrome b involved in lipid metabolism
VSKHNKKEDCWLVINNKVYDVSEFSKKHNENILLGCGKDAIKLFETRTDEKGNKIGSGRPPSEKAKN